MQHVRQLESVVLAQCKALLNALRAQGKLTYRRIHSVAIPRGDFSKGFGRFSKNKDMEGISDLVIFLPAGTTLWVELKSSVGKLSEPQKRFQDELMCRGHHYFIARSVQSLETALQTFGVETRSWVK
jgi:hypothetical protein